MTFEQAVIAVRELMEDSEIQDEGIALHQALRDLNHLAQTADGMVAVDAYEIVMAIAEGNSE